MLALLETLETQLAALMKLEACVLSPFSRVRLHVMPGSSVHGILQARILEWVAILFSSGFFIPRDQTQVSGIAGKFFTI